MSAIPAAIRREAEAIVAAGFRALAAKAHPDVGGSHEAMLRLTAARDLLEALLRGGIQRARPPVPDQAPPGAQLFQRILFDFLRGKKWTPEDLEKAIGMEVRRRRRDRR